MTMLQISEIYSSTTRILVWESERLSYVKGTMVEGSLVSHFLFWALVTAVDISSFKYPEVSESSRSLLWIQNQAEVVSGVGGRWCSLWFIVQKWSKVKLLSRVWLFARSLSGSSVHGIFQARVLEWIAISFSKGSSSFRFSFILWQKH